MKRLIPAILAVISLSTTINAQVIQEGLIQEYNEAAKKTPLAGAELRVHRAQSTVSDKNGMFSLEFVTMKPGERVSVRSIEKAGYEIFNKEAVEQWNVNPDKPFLIVMCNSAKFKQLKDMYYRNSEERYNRQYIAARNELKQLREQKRIQEQEYFDRLRKVEEDYERQLDNLDNYVDRFARIDLSELSSTEQEIINLVKEGRIEEAIARYDELGITDKLLSGISQRNEVRSAIDKLSEIEGSQTQSIDSLYAMAERQVQTLMLEGNSRNNDKIRRILCQIADADTTNVDWLLKTGEFLKTYIADYNLALKYFQSAFNSAIGEYGNDNLKTTNSYTCLGAVYDELGDYARSLEAYKKALSIHENSKVPEIAKIAEAYNNIGSVYAAIGEYPNALEYFQKALKIRTSSSNTKPDDIATLYNNIGWIYNSLGDYEQATDYYNKAIESQEKINAAGKPMLSVLYNNIGTIYDLQGNATLALEYLQKALTIREKLFGTNHPAVATSYNNIASALDTQGDYAKALEYHKKALDIREQILGANHPDVATSFFNIGRIYGTLKEYDLALSYFKKASDIWCSVFGPAHPDVATAYNAIGTTYYLTGKFPEAVDYFKKTAKIRANTFGTDHPYANQANSLILTSMINCAKEDNSYSDAIREFMIDHIWIGTVSEKDAPAAKQGMNGEYYICKFGNWIFNRDYDLMGTTSTLSGKPKTIIVLQDGIISKHQFDDQVGISFSLKKISPEEKRHIISLYEQWDANNEKSEQQSIPTEP